MKNKEIGGEYPKTSYMKGVISRRNLICVGAAVLSIRASFAASAFWKDKPASRWTPDETTDMITRSPWAKQVIAQYRVPIDDIRIQPGTPLVQRPGEPIAGECGLMPCSNIMPGRVIVIWESAQPIQEAIHPVEPPEFNGRYIISIRGLEGDYTASRLKAGAELTVKGRPPLQAGLVARRNNTWLFGFSREMLPLTTNDHDVQFSVRVGQNFSDTLVRATFNPKEMVYRDELAL
ncbi:MAG TPA: hypothetical protein VHC90_14015 [Bryobacteraceae bacterium]|nr:hypothetical protein [Bryobacteraceae bacterium]